MGLDIGLWRIDQGIERVSSTAMPLEKRLEDLIHADPFVMGQPLLIIGRQVPTAHGKFIDLLAIDGEGALHILELKKDKTPRDVVAQVLDYASWAQRLTHDDVLKTFNSYKEKFKVNQALEERFDEVFGHSLPEELNTGHYLTVVAADIDDETQRIVEYLSDSYQVPINVVFFRYFKDGDREYVARTWLLQQDQDAAPKAGGAKTMEPWNGKDWYISFGSTEGERDWDDAVKFGFASAGGGDWYTRSLRAVPIGARVWACIPKLGYVGVGTVIGEAKRFSQSAFADQPGLVGEYPDIDGKEEWALPVDWIETRSKSQALWQKGMFANQNTAARLRNQFTLNILGKAFTKFAEKVED